MAERGRLRLAAAIAMTTLLASVDQTHAQQSPRGDSKRMNINIIVGGTTVKAVLEDNPTSHDFVRMLPMTAAFEDFAGSEKISRLSKRLSTESRKTDNEANVWDITYYVPWGNIAIFYKPYQPGGLRSQSDRHPLRRQRRCAGGRDAGPYRCRVRPPGRGFQ
jgi:hypothetical protein